MMVRSLKPELDGKALDGAEQELRRILERQKKGEVDPLYGAADQGNLPRGRSTANREPAPDPPSADETLGGISCNSGVRRSRNRGRFFISRNSPAIRPGTDCLHNPAQNPDLFG